MVKIWEMNHKGSGHPNTCYRWWYINYLVYDFLKKEMLYRGGIFFYSVFLVCPMEKFTNKGIRVENICFKTKITNSLGSWYKRTPLFYFSQNVSSYATNGLFFFKSMHISLHCYKWIVNVIDTGNNKMGIPVYTEQSRCLQLNGN